MVRVLKHLNHLYRFKLENILKKNLIINIDIIWIEIGYRMNVAEMKKAEKKYCFTPQEIRQKWLNLLDLV